jgi:hypothetical protein
VQAKKATYTKRGKPVQRLARTPNSAYSMVAEYQQEFRGLAEYYALAHNRDRLSELRYVMEQSLTKTLAHKLKVSVSQVYKRFRATLSTGRGPRTGLVVTVERPGQKPLVATWGGISLTRQEKAVLNDAPAKIWNDRTEVVERLLADTCEACGSRVDVEVHHVRALNDLEKHGRDKPAWAKVMIARRRKTLVLCSLCHHYLHVGRPLTFMQQRC